MKDEFTTPVSGASYSTSFRAIATAMCVVVIVQAAAAVTGGPGIETFGAGARLWVGLALLSLLITYLLMMRGRTVIDAEGIRQSGLMERRVEWAEIHTARLAGFTFSRRLVVRSLFGRHRVFFGGTAELAAAFERIAARYPAASKRA